MTSVSTKNNVLSFSKTKPMPLVTPEVSPTQLPVAVKAPDKPEIFPPVAQTDEEIDKEVANLNRLREIGQHPNLLRQRIGIPAQGKMPKQGESRVAAVGEAIDKTIKQGKTGLIEKQTNLTSDAKRVKIEQPAAKIPEDAPILGPKVATALEAAAAQIEKLKEPVKVVESTPYNTVDELRADYKKNEGNIEYPKAPSWLQRIKDRLNTT